MRRYPGRYCPVYIATMNLGDFFALIETLIVSKPIPAVHTITEELSERQGHDISIRIDTSMSKSGSGTTPLRRELEICVDPDGRTNVFRFNQAGFGRITIRRESNRGFSAKSTRRSTPIARLSINSPRADSTRDAIPASISTGISRL